MNISYSRLCLLMLYAYANTEDSFWNTFTINIPLKNKEEVNDFFRNRLNITLHELHKDIETFTSKLSFSSQSIHD